MTDAPSLRLLMGFVIVAMLVGSVLDGLFDTRLDYWLHDAAIVKQARSRWRYVVVVVMDDDIPMEVSRLQALPLFALATERLVAAGAKDIFLDARVSKELELRMPYAACIKAKGEVAWSKPECMVTGANQCEILPSAKGRAPLSMNESALAHFRLGPFPINQQHLPDFLLFDFVNLATGLEASDRLVTRQSPIARWLDLSPNHAAIKLAASVANQRLQETLSDVNAQDVCDGDVSCLRIRLSRPLYAVQTTEQYAFLPLSQLASCSETDAMRMASLAKDKAVIFQVTTPVDVTDTVITAMTNAFFSPKQLTPGAQFLADAVETLLNQDYPRRPMPWVNQLMFFIIALATVATAVWLRPAKLWVLGLGLFLVLVGLCWLNPIVQLWPVTAGLAVFLSATLEVVTMRFVIGLRQGQLLTRYMPQQIYHLLIAMKPNQMSRNTCQQVVVLMSDLEGYTNITGILRDPESLFNLMNDYLNETSLILDSKYNGWLEGYVGDMVCYYWPVNEQNTQLTYKNALMAALELSALQQQFFATVAERYAEQFTVEVLQQIAQTIDAGIAVNVGIAAMGDLGPNKGVRKFGILGDPINLVSRMETLTRLFNTEIIIPQMLADIATTMGIVVRRLGLICVKGRNQPTMLYAMGHYDDPRFDQQAIIAWEAWLSAVERKQTPITVCPVIYALDYQTLHNWLKQDLLDDAGVWWLREK